MFGALLLSGHLLAAATREPPFEFVGTWTSRGPTGEILAVAGTTARPGTFYVATVPGMFRSDDQGESWVFRNAGLPVAPFNEPYLRSVAVDPIDPEIVYAGTEHRGLFKSSDGGRSWSPVAGLSPVPGTDGGSVRSLLIDPRNPSTVYALTDGGPFRTDDRGDSWMPLGACGLLALALDPNDSSILYGGGACGANPNQKSTDGGQTWTPLGSVADRQTVYAFAVDPSDSSTVWAGTDYRGLYKSRDGGATFHLAVVSYGGGTNLVRSLAIGSSDGSVIYMGTLGGLFHTVDRGAHWLPVGLDSPIHEIEAIAIGAGEPSIVLVAQPRAHLFRTQDAGSTWVPVEAGINTGYVSDVMTSPVDSLTAFAAIQFGGLFSTVDGGATWPLGDLTNSFLTSLAFAPSDPRILYAAGEGGAARSTNGGRNWSGGGNLFPNGFIGSVAVDLVNPDVVFVGSHCCILNAADDTGLHESADAGETWTLLSAGSDVNTVAVDASDDAIYAYDRLGLQRSEDGGATWETLPLNTAAAVVTMRIDSLDARTIYAGTQGAGLFKSSDRGQTWRHVGAGLSSELIARVVIDPLSSNVVYAATGDAGVFRSSDAGETWIAMNQGLDDLALTSLSINSKGTILYAGTSHRGVFQIDLRRPFALGPR